MKIGILTFQFAQNYGAMLQAFALKEYLRSLGYTAEVIPYYPLHFQIQYQISPFVKGMSIKRRIRNVLFYFKQVQQAQLFNRFKQEKIYNKRNEKEFWNIEQLQKKCKEFDLIIFGSDQIWNDQITQADEIYFGGNLLNRKISYAASIGIKNYSQIQLEYIKNNLSEFEAISVREPEAKNVIEKYTKKQVDIVCDPVFLFSLDEWKKNEVIVKVNKPYILLYMLENDEKLLKLAHEYAEKERLVIYEVHPTLWSKQKGTQQLRKIGPGEFLYLVNHAEYICTNSFHAVSFSIIYKKKLIHIPNSKSPERTIAILSRLGLENKNSSIYREDLNTCNYSKLEEFIIHSKKYLAEVIK